MQGHQEAGIQPLRPVGERRRRRYPGAVQKSPQLHCDEADTKTDTKGLGSRYRRLAKVRLCLPKNRALLARKPLMVRTIPTLASILPPSGSRLRFHRLLRFPDHLR